MLSKDVVQNIASILSQGQSYFSKGLKNALDLMVEKRVLLGVSCYVLPGGILPNEGDGWAVFKSTRVCDHIGLF